jgi:hypothetical protein
MQPDQRVALALAFLQGLLHTIAWSRSVDPRLIGPHLVALLHDLLILASVVMGSRLLRRALPAGAQRVAVRLSIVSLIAVGMLLAIYPQLLREYLAFPVNLFGASAGSVQVMVREYLGIGRLWPVLAVVSVSALALCWSPRAWRRTRTAMAASAIVLTAVVFTLPQSPNPWVLSIQQSAAELLMPDAREVRSLERPPTPVSESIDRKLAVTILQDPAAPTHIFLLVLEGVTSLDFERDFLGKPDGFHAGHRDRALYFSRFHATNLDSYTSLIAMLTGIQVPYRAYADEDSYVAVNRAGNLARALRGAGFFNVFVSTYAHQPFVPTREDWDRVLDRSSLPTLEGWVSLGSSRMEAATEDRAALSTIVDLAQSHEKCFILHELVYGHSTEWRAATGQSQLSYYDLYLTELASALERTGLLERSLLVIVSDHGDRARSSDAENYRVPLLIVGVGVPAGSDGEFRSHLDLPAIVAAAMGRTALPPPRASQFLVGSTERWVYGQLRSEGGYLFIDDRAGTVSGRRGALDAASVRSAFQSMLNAFGAEFGRRSD